MSKVTKRTRHVQSVSAAPVPLAQHQRVRDLRHDRKTMLRSSVKLTARHNSAVGYASDTSRPADTVPAPAEIEFLSEPAAGT